MNARRGHAAPLLLLVAMTLAGWAFIDHLAVRTADAPRLVSDGTYYADIARSVARGEGYVDRCVRPVQAANYQRGPELPSGMWSPLFPALTAVAFLATGPSSTITLRPLVPVLVNLTGFVLAVVALYALARQLVPRAAWLAPLALALDPRSLLNATDGLTEGWSAAFLVLTAWALGSGGRRLPLGGLLFSAAVLTRASNVAVLPVYLLVVWLHRLPRPARDPIARPLRTGRALAAFLLPVVVVLGGWMLVRASVAGSPLVEIQRYNLLHDLGPWVGSSAYRTLEAPDPGVYLLGHPLAAAGKLLSGLGKSAILLPTRFWNLFALTAAAFGIASMCLRDATGRRPRVAAAVVLAAPALVQIVLMSMTLLEPRLFLPTSVPLFVAVAVGVRELVDRAPPARRRDAMGIAVALVVLLPFGRLCGELATEPAGERRAARGAAVGATTRGAMAALVAHHVPISETLITDWDSVIWDSDRKVVTRPEDPRELDRLRTLTGARYLLWEPGDATGRKGPGAARHEAWSRHLGALEATGRTLRVADTTVTGRTFALSAWSGAE